MVKIKTNDINTTGSSSGQVLQVSSGSVSWTTLTKSDVGLSNVDNTSDANKPISNATQSALDLKLDISSAFSGSYNDLTDTPTLFDGAFSSLTGKPTTLSGYGITDAISSSLLGATSGVATLDSSGKVPSGQLPSYVDDVLEYTDYASLPGTGETGKIYLTLDDNKIYRWTGSTYLEIAGSINSINDLGDVTITSPSADQILQYNGSAWVNATFSSGASALDDLTDVVITTPADSEYLKYSSGSWVNAQIDYSEISGAPSLSGLVKADGTVAMSADLDLNSNKVVNLASGSTTGDAVEYDQFTTALALKQDSSSAFSGDYNDLSNKPSIPTSIEDLNNVTLTTPTDGQVLAWDTDTSQWVNSVIVTDGAAFFTEISAIGTGVSQDITLPYSGYTDDLVFVFVNGLMVPTDQYSISGTTLTLTTNNSGDKIRVRSVQIGGAVLSDLIPSVIGDLSDVVITTPATDQVLQYDGTNWINSTINLSTDLDGLSDVVITSPTSNQVLTYNGSNWINDIITSLPTGGTSGQVLTKNSETDGDASWITPAYNVVPITSNAATSYTLVLSDVYVRSTSASATTITVPPNSSVAYPVGTQISIIQAGTGQITIAPGSGVTINISSPATYVSRTQFSIMTLTKVATDEWDLVGDLVLS